MSETVEQRLIKLAEKAAYTDLLWSQDDPRTAMVECGVLPNTASLVAACDPTTVIRLCRVVQAARKVGYAPELGRGGYFGGQALSEALRELDNEGGSNSKGDR